MPIDSRTRWDIYEHSKITTLDGHIGKDGQYVAGRHGNEIGWLCSPLKVFVRIYDQRWKDQCVYSVLKGTSFGLKLPYQLVARGRMSVYMCVCVCVVSSEAEAARNLCCDSFDTCRSGNVAYGR